MPFVETDHWILEIPDEWSADYEEDVVTISDPDAVGSIDISSVVKEQGAIEESDLATFAADLLEEGRKPAAIELFDFQGWYFEYDAEDLYWREWFLYEGGLLVYATYSTELQHKGLDDVVVDQIIETLVPNQPEKTPATTA